MRPNPCWELYKDEEFKRKKNKIIYYLQEFYTDDQVILSKYLGKKLWKLEKRRTKFQNKHASCNNKIENIMKKILKKERKCIKL